MSEPTAEQIAHRALDVNLLDARQLDVAWGEFGTRNVDASEFCNLLLRKELLTNFQLEKLLRKERTGYFYGDYKVLYLVGTGTFARVFRAVNVQTDRIVALKVLRRRWCDDIEKTEQFVREGQMGTSLRHPGIVPIYEVHSDKRQSFLVMEFVEGQNLRHFVRVRQKVEPMDAARLMLDIAGGLAYAFDRGVTHRDLKLSNVLVSSKGRARLVDFGLAAVGESNLSDEKISEMANPRTIDYAALERATGVRKDDKRSDVYFTGCIFYHMLCGSPPLRETRDRLQRMSTTRFEEVIPLSKMDESLPFPLTRVVEKAMQMLPSARYQSPGEMVEDLQAAKKRLEQAAETGEDLSVGKNAEAASDVTQPIVNNTTVAGEGQGKTVMVVESNVGMQDVLRKQLKNHGYRVLVIGDPKRAIARFQDQFVADCILFCSNHLGEDALRAFNEFGTLERTRRIGAILLLGEKQHSWQDKAQTASHRHVLAMPVGMKALRAAIKKCVGNAVPE